MIFFKKKDKKIPSIELSELEELRTIIVNTNMPDDIQKVALDELEKMYKIDPTSSEYYISLNYLNYIVSLPWNKFTEDNLDIKRVEKVLNQEHYGLYEVKERILEYLAVRILKSSLKFKILVVDDERLTCKNLEHVLKKEGYEVEVAYNGVDAVQLLNQKSFDLVITDLKMEQVDGIGVLEEAKRKNPSTEVIIITGYATVPVAVDAIQKGSYQFLPKPLKLDEIKKVVREALSKKEFKLNTQGPILCFVGPPGVGKTSLGISIARSLKRRLVMMSLGGIKDEAQLRGHRRTYVGALPGRIIQEIKRAEVSNPVFILDEIDKIGQDFKGDPSAVLLEILDPSQNKNFFDHYLDVPFDLSQVMFIATANTTDSIPLPLLDRLEIINLPGYTEEEKLEIAFGYLIPREIEAAGLDKFPPTFHKNSVKKIIREYTQEAGLRNLQRAIASICRKIAKEILYSEQEKEIEVDEKKVKLFLGPPKFHPIKISDKNKVGICTALAWTPMGGQVVFIEAAQMSGKGQLILTGSLGDILKESAKAALSFLRSNASLFNISNDFFSSHDIHIHVPLGAVPKDGPSAGLPIAIALISAITKRPCKREIASSGELTLTGRILPVAGIREKIIAARNAEVKTVILPAKNKADIDILPEYLKKDIKIILANDLLETVDQALLP